MSRLGLLFGFILDPDTFISVKTAQIQRREATSTRILKRSLVDAEQQSKFLQHRSIRALNEEYYSLSS